MEAEDVQKIQTIRMVTAKSNMQHCMEEGGVKSKERKMKDVLLMCAFQYKTKHYFLQSLDLGEAFWETLSLPSISVTYLGDFADFKAHSNSKFPYGC